MISLGDTAITGVFYSSQNSKCQDLSKFQFSGEGVFCTSQTQKCQDLPKFQLLAGRGCSVVVKTESTKICLNFNFGGGGRRGVFCTKFQNRVFLANLSANFALPLSGSLCITDKSYHILRMWRLINHEKCETKFNVKTEELH